MTLTHTAKVHNFLAGMDEAQIARLTATAKEVDFNENELILSAQERSKYFYLLLSGSVCVEVSAKSFVVCVQALGPGEAFGWSALLDHHDTLFQVRAREHCRALCIDARDLSAILKRDPELAAEVLRRALELAAQRIQATEARLAELCGVPMAKNSNNRRTSSR